MKQHDGSYRAISIGAVMAIVVVIFMFRLFYVQVFQSKWADKAQSNSVLKNITVPARGLIYDRDSNLIVYNEPAYDLYVTPRSVKSLDTLAFAKLLDVDKEVIVAGIKKAAKYSSYKASLLAGPYTAEQFANVQESLYKYSGFTIRSRTIRQYPYQNSPHILGYVGEASRSVINRDDYYAQGDFIGVSGIEREYETQLRGVKGVSYRMKDVHNRIKGKYNGGRSDTTAVIGANLISTLDIDLQSYGEKLMHGKRGGVVAIEPKSGEILALISAPTFNPSLLVGKERGKNFQMLKSDKQRPLLNRASSASYPPGSTFKLLQTLIGLGDGAITKDTRFPCSGAGTRPIKCSHFHGSPVSLLSAIEQSCNPYFWNAFKTILYHHPTTKKGFPKEGYQVWYDYVLRFGFGARVGHDVYSESSGSVPSVKYYDRVYRGSWSALTVRSLSIGQGEMLCTPLQMANLCAAIANRGYFYSPHLVKQVVYPDGKVEDIEVDYNTTEIDTTHFNTVIEGMSRVFHSGTGRGSLVSTIEMCGKTGTVQNPHGKDHSVFMAFAPKESPKISIYVYIENGGYGSTYAGPIASLMMERYISGTISEESKRREEKILNTNLIESE